MSEFKIGDLVIVIDRDWLDRDRIGRSGHVNDVTADGYVKVQLTATADQHMETLLFKPAYLRRSNDILRDMCELVDGDQDAYPKGAATALELASNG